MKTETVKNEVATRSSTAIAAEKIIADWGAPQMSVQDFTIPRILLMQSTSPQVKENKFQNGDLVDSLTNKKLGGFEKPIDIIPFYMERVWYIKSKPNAKAKLFEYDRQEPITPSNEVQQYEQIGEGGKLEHWYRTQNFYVLIPSEIDAGTALPYLISFKSSAGGRAGKKLATTMYMKNTRAGKPPAAMVMELSVVTGTNEVNTFAAYDVSEKRESRDYEIGEAFDWVQKVKKGAVKVDESSVFVDEDPFEKKNTAPAQTEPQGSEEY